MTDLRVLIVDDEPLVRRGLRSFLDREPGVLVVGSARNGSEALDAIRTRTPDVVFLDVQMPEMNGFAVVEAIEPEARPAIVFVTAYDAYAIRAFDVHAVDYLLKPFDEERFRRALDRVRARLAQPDEAGAGRLQELLSDARNHYGYVDRLLIRDRGRVVVVPVADVEWLEAADNYVNVHTRTAQFLMRDTLKSLEQRLDPAVFARAHRSAIVNLGEVQFLEPLAGGENHVTLTSGARVTLSRTCRDEFRNRLAGFRR